MKRRFPFYTPSNCFPINAKRSTEFSRFTAIDPESDLFSSSTALFNCTRLSCSCRYSVYNSASRCLSSAED